MLECVKTFSSVSFCVSVMCECMSVCMYSVKHVLVCVTDALGCVRQF